MGINQFRLYLFLHLRTVGWFPGPGYQASILNGPDLGVCCRMPILLHILGYLKYTAESTSAVRYYFNLGRGGARPGDSDVW